ncbi:DEKNAAC101931 [Brettanomyces naardenensis]|uniref:DASH complex subunit ASK1 n=1 Tax=Brettanomyces naardenensis TaxID=13370 RepID=A0A448YJH6_BRENA|nr:DEKNAAC101931 [Brettanomyces naardenensis]
MSEQEESRRGSKKGTITPTTLSTSAAERLRDGEKDTSEGPPRRPIYYSSTATPNSESKQREVDEIDKVERLITLTLQGIDKDLSDCNSVVTDKVHPTVEQYSTDSSMTSSNINHIKEFFENAANVNIVTNMDIQEAERLSPIRQGSGDERNDGPPEVDKSQLNYSTPTATLGTSSASREFNDRYRENFSPSGQQAETTTGDNTNTVSYSEPPADLQHLLGLSHDENTSVSTDGLKLTVTDESTGRILHTNEIEPPRTPPKRKADTVTKLSPSSKRSKYISDLIKQYDSPPWEDPPELQSTRYRSSGSRSRSRSGSRSRPKMKAADDEVRFPRSPKYGGGGKLLRSDRGRKLALDYSKVELTETNPILTVDEPRAHKDDTNVDTSSFEAGNYSLNTSSTFENPPELLTERLDNRLEERGDDKCEGHQEKVDSAAERLKAIEIEFGLDDDDDDELDNPPSLLTERLDRSGGNKKGGRGTSESPFIE